MEVMLYTLIMKTKKIQKNFVVASDYNWLPENIEDSWVHKYTDNYLIYDKFHRFKESDKIKHQLNVGQNIYDMFDFIVTHYDNLPDCTLFCRACLMWPKDTGTPMLDENGKRLSNGNCSEEKFNELMNNDTFTELHDFGPEVHTGLGSRMGENGGFLEINNSWYFNHVKSKYFNNTNTFLNEVFVNPDLPEYIRFSPGGNYIIPKKTILKYSKNFYEQIRHILSWDKVVGEAHMIERCIYTFFTCDYEVKEKYK
jgi:hypothetical protein